MTDKTSVADWSTTADDNDNIAGILLGENKMRPSDVNGAIRTMMAQLKTEDDALRPTVKISQETVALAIADTPVADPDYYDVAYYDSDFIEDSGALYQKRASEPSHLGKFQNGNGTWYEITGSRLSIAAFGAKPGSYAIDNGPAIQAAHDALPSSGGEIFIPKVVGGAPYNETGRWAFATPLNFTKPVTIVGESAFQAQLCYNGAENTIGMTAGVYGIDFTEVTYVGVPDADGTSYTKGVTGYKSTGVVRSFRSQFLFFQTLSEYNGGYYHRHAWSLFQNCKIFFSDYNANNISFIGCSANTFENLITCTGGVGPVSYIGGSIELWKGFAIKSLAGAQFSVALVGTYVENYPSTACPAGIGAPGDTFDNSLLVANDGAPVLLSGCQISTKGMVHVVSHSGVAVSSITSIGNFFQLFNTAPNNILNQVYVLGTDSTLVTAGDQVSGTPPTGAIFSNSPTRGEGFDPFTKLPLRLISEDFIAPTLQNGWINTAGISGARVAGYARDRKGEVKLRGVVDGSASSAGTIFTLPTGYRPTVKSYQPAFTAGGTTCMVSINTDGTVTLITNATSNQVSLDGITFRSQS